MKDKTHYTAQYLMNPQHPITINVIGAGGNGSQVLTQLARMDKALKGLSHPGLHITLFDDDKVSESNMGRQLFSPAEIGLNKATALITRVNRFFGTSWTAIPFKFSSQIDKKDRCANITISCVDTVKARKEIKKLLRGKPEIHEPYHTQYYWMDLGNGQNSGQFVIGTCRKIKQALQHNPGHPGDKFNLQPEHIDAVETLPNVFDKFPAFEKQKDNKTGPSCSLAEALDKQDLFINSALTQFAMHTLWKMFREGKIKYHGAFINMDTLRLAPLYIL